MRNNFSPITDFNWHLWREEKPTEPGWYLLMQRIDVIDTESIVPCTLTGQTYIELWPAKWITLDNKQCFTLMENPFSEIVAWMRIPECSAVHWSELELPELKRTEE